MRIKTLPLEYWMDGDELFEEDITSQSPVLPRFGRPGIYMVGKDCWFEMNDGRSFAYEIDMFIHKLNTLNASILNQRQVDALQGVIEQKMASKAQKELYWNYLHAMECRRIYRDSRLHMLRFDKDPT